ncbi:unnamed protein product [Clonostachys rosea f. rosea IK726]|uniref:Uncharacterized protein n=1 Tax=Clonostachys rosea f. rosea IK726 TaxID=1349383 RepID=A0ACA9TCN0_BIOOC|nr:unnamed protein product [Clonostachys rosea f. rosea IK726]
MKFALFLITTGAALAAPSEIFMKEGNIFCWDLCSFEEPKCPDQMPGFASSRRSLCGRNLFQD